MNCSTITVTTAEGAQTFAVGNDSAITIDSPAPGGGYPNHDAVPSGKAAVGGTGPRYGGTFTGFAQRFASGINDGASVTNPISRVSVLAFQSTVGSAPSPDAIVVTLAGGTGGGAWTKATTVPVRTAGTAPSRSTLTITNAIVGDGTTRQKYDKTISLDGLSAISLTEAS